VSEETEEPEVGGGGGPVGADAAGVPSLFAAAGAVAAAASVDETDVAGFGAGFEKNVWYAYSTRNDMKSAMRTRRSNSVPWGHRVVAAGAEWLAPDEALQPEPGPSSHTVGANGLGRVIRTRREEPARAGKQR